MRALGWVLAIVTLAGCVSSGRPVDQTRVAAFQRGKTTSAQVLAALGPPNGSSVLGDGSSVLVYTYTHAQARPETFIPIIGPLVGGADATSQTISFTFGPDGVLRSQSSYQSQAAVGTGLAASGTSAQVAAAPIQAPPPSDAAPARRELGIRVLPVTASLAFSLQMGAPRGLIVEGVTPGGAASDAGIQVGDVILAYDGAAVMAVDDIQRQLAATIAGASVSAEIRRGPRDFTVQLQF
jgi:membrane-associated protease RseP (regulator of RpoE activity)